MTHNGFSAEALNADEMEDYQKDWADLAKRALEPNAFFEPGFALAATRLFPARSRPLFIAVWKEEPGLKRRRLMALCPVIASKSMFGDGLARVWLHKQAALATPLLDRLQAAAALDALFGWLERYMPTASGIVFHKIGRSGPTFEALMAAAQSANRQTDIFEEYQRAVFIHGEDADEAFEKASSRKALKELYRRRRRLEELGHVEYLQFTKPDEVRRAVEDFLVLEASGWKKGRGALLSQAALATFFRSATRALAHERKCQIHSLTLDGRPLAMGVVLESGGRAFFWKIAYDEAYRSQAPGVELVHSLTKAQTARADLDMTDSCAIANHPLIDRVWPQRIGLCDLVVQLQAGRARAFAQACRGEARRRSIRAFAKSAVVRFLNRKVS
jgi:CelD/BcsL family acetyltransferase involved in cellulose biosynthesis